MHFRFDTLIESARLKDPTFDLPRWYRQMVVHTFAPEHQSCFLSNCGAPMGYALAHGAQRCLLEAIPWPDHLADSDVPRFSCRQGDGIVRVFDRYLQLALDIPNELLENIYFDLPNYFATHARRLVVGDVWSLWEDLDGELEGLFSLKQGRLRRRRRARPAGIVQLNAVSPRSQRRADDGQPDAIAALQRNAASARDIRRLIPEPVVVVVNINGHPARALLDSGSLSDFMSAKMAHQLGVKVFELEKPLPVHLAVQGSRAKINFGCRAVLEYQNIRDERYFDVVNLLNYDLILGTPFLYQHKVSFSFNPTAVVIGSPKALPIEGKTVRVLQSHSADVLEAQLALAREELRQYAAPICKEASDSPLPPLRAINHRIPLIDEHKVYSWRPSKCPDALRSLWTEKRDAYLKS
ncbi:hypothetical protein PYCCODRAFT_1373452, partial [Trametes coccinea BRFM310]